MRLAIFNLLDPVTGKFNIPSDELNLTGETGSVSLGDSGLSLKGSSTMWHDMVGDIFSKRINNNGGKVDYDWEKNAIKFQPGADPTKAIDRVQFNIQFDHDCLLSKEVGGATVPFCPHIHWFEPINNMTLYTFRLYYRLVKNGGVVDTTVLIPNWDYVELTMGHGASADKFNSAVSGAACCSIGQISVFPDLMFDAGLSDTVQMALVRMDNEQSNVFVYFMDAHVQASSFGSNHEWVK